MVKAPHRFPSLAIAGSPTWHRRERARRSKARQRVRNFLERPSDKRLELARKSVHLLERHHSAPRYLSFRRLALRMSAWRGGQSYQYWGTSRRTPKQQQSSGAKGKNKGKTKEEKKKPEETAKENTMCPAYDDMAIPTATSTASSSKVGGEDGPWQLALQGLVAANPSLTLPPELEAVMSGNKAADAKKDLYDQQKSLNMKRKATQKLERMEQALRRKRFQMEAYREQLRQQLHMEMQRFSAETKDLEAEIEKQREVVARLEKGIVKEEDEHMEAFVDVQDQPSLAMLLGIQDDQETEERIARLQREKQEAVMLAQKMNEKMRIMMAAQPMPGGAVPTGASPQMPFGGTTRRGRDTPQDPQGTPKDRPERSRSVRPKNEVEVVGDSPEVQQQDAMD